MRRRRAALALAAVTLTVAATLTGCAVPVNGAWQPPQWPAATVSVAEQPAPMDAAAVPSWNGQRIRNDAVGIQARWSLLPGDHPLNARVTSDVTGAIAARSAATGRVYTPTVFPQGAGLGARGCVTGSTIRPAAEVLADPAMGPAGGAGTAVVCDILLATGEFVGQRVRIVSGGPDGVASDTSITYYANVASGEVVSPAQLWAEGAAAVVWEAAVDLLRRDAGSLSLAPAAPPDEAQLGLAASALDTTAVAPGGALVVALPAGLTSPELAALGIAPTTAPLVIGVPAATAASLTTAFGASLTAAAASAQPYAAPAVVPSGFEPIDCDLVPCVAITYDDGPSELTPQILDALAAHHAGATFFALGSKAAAYTETLQRTVAEGHDVENHTWNHPRLPTLTPAQVSSQIRDTTTALQNATGERVVVFRPPYGEYNPQVLAAAGMAAIMWDVDTLDWQKPADDVLVARAVDGPSPGSIVLLHDVHEGTARTATATYEGLLDRGFTLVTLTQLFDGTLPSSGVWRFVR